MSLVLCIATLISWSFAYAVYVEPNCKVGFDEVPDFDNIFVMPPNPLPNTSFVIRIAGKRPSMPLDVLDIESIIDGSAITIVGLLPVFSFGGADTYCYDLTFLGGLPEGTYDVSLLMGTGTGPPQRLIVDQPVLSATATLQIGTSSLAIPTWSDWIMLVTSLLVAVVACSAIRGNAARR